MATLSHLIVGLGNPGPDYAATRHNIGFMALDALAEHCRALPWKKKFRGEAATADYSAHSMLLLKPMTYMNLSGESVGEALRFHKLAPENVIVIHDDLDLQTGQAKIKQGGGSGGHNGIKSIDAHIGPNYWRIRLGIGRPGESADKGNAVTNYVLNPFAKSDLTWLQPLLDAVTGEFDLMLAGKHADYLNRITQKMNAALPPKN
jgi:PTH1 family peptidyl-tRNA hydrolase